MRPRIMLLAVPLLLAASACASSGDNANREPRRTVSEKQAIAILDHVVSRAPHLSATRFCKELAYQQKACAYVRKQADDFCLKPGPKPRVLRSKAVRPTKDSDGGRVLEVEGKTAGGHRYVSEFFVTAPEGKPLASTAVYWSGAGLADSPLGESNKVLPQSECGDDAPR
ncbi:hypothetical protein GKQ77_25000 [Streptomyces sp. BG9H]|uniref:Lipoprotein n=1 Tax=Streptomyces anatolicus TaxID=2675858 RepID=A0ABS6YTN3_9ACTN|nr:hypothetical protein [Streptomyces anatolicus]MBW5424784.1 hypothetical protein [Streptomyces anatolicus]